jgi:hypothetical protein
MHRIMYCISPQGIIKKILNSDRDLCIKIVNIEDKDTVYKEKRKRVDNEIKLMQVLNSNPHTNIIKIVEIEECETYRDIKGEEYKAIGNQYSTSCLVHFG